MIEISMKFFKYFFVVGGIAAMLGIGIAVYLHRSASDFQGLAHVSEVTPVSQVTEEVISDEDISVDDHTIRMGTEGYRPPNLTIQKGETVTFLNTDTKEHWPASDIHPSHAVYPAFDPKYRIPPGESWSFTFERPGEWRYHDHILPDMSGVIMVEGEESSSPTLPKPSSQNKNPTLTKEKALILLADVNMIEIAKNETALRELINQSGPRAVMDDLLADSGGGSTIDCHQESHTIGRVAYEEFGVRTFREGDASCHSGFYHGAIEAFLAERGTQNVAEDVKEVCDAFPTAFGRFECLHGIGHGLMAYQDYDLPLALRTCDRLATDYDRSSCYGGIFMENIVTAQGFGAIPGHDTKWANKDPHVPCSIIDQAHSVQFQCYQMQTSWMLTLFDYDFDRAVPECLKAPADMVSVCFKSFGRDAAGHTLRNPQKIRDICEKVPQEKDFYLQCVVGAINVIVDFWGDGLENQGAELCAALPEKGKESCYTTLASRLRGLFNEETKRSAVCAAFEPAYQSLCNK